MPDAGPCGASCSCCCSSVRAGAPRLPGPLIAVLLARRGGGGVRPRAIAASPSSGVPAGLCPSRGSRTCRRRRPRGHAAARARHHVVGVHRQRAHRTGLRRAHGQRIDANQELLALGAANVAAGLLHGLPGQQQRQPHRHRRRHRQPEPALLARRLAASSCGPAAPRPAPRAFPIAPRSAPSSSTRPSGSSTSRSSAGSAGSAAASWSSPSPPPSACSLVDVLYGVLLAVAPLAPATCCARVARAARRRPRLRAGTRRHARRRRLSRGPTGAGLVVYRYDSPLFFANADDFRRRALAAVDEAAAGPSSGSCSTPRPTSRSTSPRSTRSTSCDASSTGAASCSPWPGSSRTCSTTSTPPVSPTPSGPPHLPHAADRGGGVPRVVRGAPRRTAPLRSNAAAGPARSSRHGQGLDCDRRRVGGATGGVAGRTRYR